MHSSFVRRFWSKVAVVDHGDCWEWKAAKWRNGYGAIRLPGTRKNIGAHRAAWELTHGVIPADMAVCHRCDNRGCCNPKHLFLGSTADNNADMRSKGRGSSPPIHRGESHPMAKITAADVTRARERLTSGEPVSRVAKDLGISRKTLSQLRDRETWRHVL